MQVLTASQFRQLRLTVEAAYDAIVLIEDAFCHTLDRVLVALTSEKAIAAYRITAKVAYHSVMLTAAAAFYAGVLTRQGWELFVKWAAEYVAKCETPIEVSPSPELEAPEPVAEVLPPSQMVVNPSPTLLLPPAKIEPTVEAPKKRGQPRKAAIA